MSGRPGDPVLEVSGLAVRAGDVPLRAMLSVPIDVLEGRARRLAGLGLHRRLPGRR